MTAPVPESGLRRVAEELIAVGPERFLLNYVSLVIDLPRYESIFLGNLSRALVQETPRRRGRPSRIQSGARAIGAARLYGVDLGLVQAALARTPAERLAMLEANAGFIRGMRKRET